MKTNLKRRICIFLCLLLTLPGILAALPQAELKVQAAGTVYLNWSTGIGNSYSTPEFQMTKKTTGFYMGDYIRAAESATGVYKDVGILSLNSGVKYKSSKPSVVDINKSTGLIKAKKNGTANITITFK